MPSFKRYFQPGQLQFITSSTYHRVRVFESERSRKDFVEILNQLRQRMGFLLIGWVLMPEHCHLLIKPEPASAASLIMQEFKRQTAFRIITTLRENCQLPWRRRTLAGLRLPPTVHDESSYRVWQRRFYPFGVYSDKKRLEKLDYMHNNPVKRGLVSSPEQWPWSSFRFYYLQDSSVLKMGRMV